MVMRIGLMMILLMMMMITTIAIGDATNVLGNALTQLRSASGAPVALGQQTQFDAIYLL